MYSIVIKIKGFESRRRNAGLLHIILGFFLILKAYDFFHLTGNFIPIFPVLIVASVSLFYGFFRRKMDNSAKYNFWLRLLQVITFIVFGVAMIRVGRPLDYYGLFLWAALALILMFSEKKIFEDTVLYIKEEGIAIPGFYRDYLVDWEDLDDVVVRHDFVTLFNREEKFLQFQVMQTLSELELAKMNAFCREKIESSQKPEAVSQ